jgi:tRNA threonylcarbamoyladenosine biosynthesis protein TsaE
VIVHVATTLDMEALGVKLAKNCDAGMTILLKGELGTGKTTLVRGFLRARGHEGPVKSPTFTLLEPYELLGVPIYHFDLYRISGPEELEFLGVRDYLRGDGICLVEWPERAQGCFPTADLAIEIDYENTGRQVQIISHTEAGGTFITRVKKAKVSQ